MNTVIRHIEYLISRNDCVIIPGLGAILAKTVGACTSDDCRTLTPPRRIYTFNSGLRHNDAMLATSIQRAEQTGYDSAMRKVKAGVDEIASMLRLNGEAVIGRVGTLTIDPESDVPVFTAAEADLLSVDTFWLERIDVAPIDETGTNIIEAPIVKRSASAFRRLVRTAAGIAMLLAIGFVISTPVSVDNTTLASMAPEIHRLTMQDIAPTKPQAPEQSLTVYLPEAPAVETRVDASATPANRYYLIVASLASDTEAQRYIDSQPAGLHLLSDGTHHRVYHSAHATYEDAYRASLDIKNTYPTTWVCKQ